MSLFVTKKTLCQQMVYWELAGAGDAAGGHGNQTHHKPKRMHLCEVQSRAVSSSPIMISERYKPEYDQVYSLDSTRYKLDQLTISKIYERWETSGWGKAGKFARNKNEQV